MPKNVPTISYQQIRNYTEKWQWRDVSTGLLTVGYVAPESAKDKQRVPFFIRYVTKKGKLEQGNAVTLTVKRKLHQRMIQFVDSKEIRMVADYLVISVDGTRFVTH